ncbi:MAG: xanthan lyase, partial [Candidatus Cryptobacteroides sp.]
ATAEWTVDIRRDGEYAVYVTWRSFPESTENAHYSVTHAGGVSSFLVNQKMGGGTWIYLGTFPFRAGTPARISLDSGEGTGVLSADAVRIGGGRGNIARGPAKEVSGLPRGLEGARYSLQWNGAPVKVWHPWNEEENDYRDDYTSRGLWTGWISGGSQMNRKEDGLGIPLDLALAFHTDAGTALRDTTIGTLVLYSSSNEGKKALPSGEKMSTSREYAHLVQSQVVSDIRESFGGNWTRREIRDRAYMETRSPACPSMILELLSHQNFNDMKYGLDPAFRFVASRAVYKGMLKYLSNRYGTDYAVQPLPVEAFAAVLEGDEVCLSWKPREDRLEPTAAAEKYLLETRRDGGAFGTPEFVETESIGDRVCCRVKVGKGSVWSFRVSAWNRGGISFPSETLSVGIPLESKGKVLIVNNFDRVSAPVYFEDESIAGFNADLDSGADYIRSINYVGEMYEFRRSLDWADDDCPGFGASYTDCAELCPAGNSFDYTALHGHALLVLGYCFDSMSAAALGQLAEIPDSGDRTAIDLICGKQVSTPAPDGIRYSIFPKELRSALMLSGCPLIVSGSYIGSEGAGGIYRETVPDPDVAGFTANRLGFRLMNSRASRRGVYRWTGKDKRNSGKFNMAFSDTIYRVESPDGIVPANADAKTIIRYADSGISAAIAYDGGNGKAVSFGFPIECITEPEDIEDIFRYCLDFFSKNEEL